MSYTSKAPTRVVQSIGDPGKWQAQYRDADLEGLWCDLGDACDTEAQAREKIATWPTVDATISAIDKAVTDYQHERVSAERAMSNIAAALADLESGTDV